MRLKLYSRIKRRRAIVLDAFERALDALESFEEGIDQLPYVQRQLGIAWESLEMAIDLVGQSMKVVNHE